MSLDITPLRILKTQPPNTRIGSDRAFAIVNGPMQNSFKPITSTSVSNSSIAFTAPPPSVLTMVDRRILIGVTVSLLVTGTVVAPYTNLGDDWPNATALRAFPLQSIVSTASMTINGNSVTLNTSDMLSALLRIRNSEKQVQDRQFSITPAMLDQFQTYGEGFETNRNPLGEYGDNPYVTPRGGFSNYVISGSTPTSYTVTFTVVEELLLPPLLFGGKEEAAFIGLNSMDCLLTLGDLSRMISHDTVHGNVYTSITASPGITSAVMYMQYMNPSPLVPLPKAAVYPYSNITRFPTDVTPGTSISAGASFTVTMNNITLPSIPQRIILFVRRSNQNASLANSATFATTDTFAAITNVNINFMNTPGILSSCSQQNLYEIAAENGVEMSWPQWSNYVGSVLPLDFGKDLSVQDSSMAPGFSTQAQLQVILSCTNTSSVSIQYTAYIVVIQSGTYTIIDGSAVPMTSVISQADVLASASAPSVEYSAMQSQQVGGDLFSGLKSLVGDFLPAAKAAIESHPVGALASRALKGALCDQDGPEPKRARRSSTASQSGLASRLRRHKPSSGRSGRRGGSLYDEYDDAGY